MPASLAHLKRQRDVISEVLRRLDDVTLADLHRRARHPASDGFGSGRPELAVAAASDNTPVEASVLANYRVNDETGEGWWATTDDPVGRALAELFGALSEAAGVLMGVNRNLDYVTHAKESAEGWVSSLQGSCAACDRDVAGTENDRLKAGYCPACYTAWLRDGRPDRLKFERERRNGRAS